jgi:hypothetical protein
MRQRLNSFAARRVALFSLNSPLQPEDLDPWEWGAMSPNPDVADPEGKVLPPHPQRRYAPGSTNPIFNYSRSWPSDCWRKFTRVGGKSQASLLDRNRAKHAGFGCCGCSSHDHVPYLDVRRPGAGSPFRNLLYSSCSRFLRSRDTDWIVFIAFTIWMAWRPLFFGGLLVLIIYAVYFADRPSPPRRQRDPHRLRKVIVGILLGLWPLTIMAVIGIALLIAVVIGDVKPRAILLGIWMKRFVEGQDRAQGTPFPEHLEGHWRSITLKASAPRMKTDQIRGPASLA